MQLFTNLLSWIIFGSVIASLAYIIEPQLRTIKTYTYGIMGAIFTGMITNLLLSIPFEQFSLVSLFVAMFGASLVVFSTGLLRKI